MLDEMWLKKIIAPYYFKLRYQLSGTDVFSTDGKDYLYPSVEQERLEYNLMTELKVMEELVDSIKPSDVFFDIGADLGVYSCLVSEKVKSGDVIAFEPSPITIHRLKHVLNMNNADVIVQPIGLSNFDGDVPFSGYEISKSNQRMTIPVKRADSIIPAQVPQPDVMKIDVEGAELSVLEGFGDYLSPIRTIFCELHPKSEFDHGLTKTEQADLRSLLKSSGFSVSEIQDRDGQMFIKAQK